MAVKSASKLTLYDILSRLSFAQACKWLGPCGTKLLAEGAKFDLDPELHVWLDNTALEFRLPKHGLGREVKVRLIRTTARRDGVTWKCSEKKNAEVYVAAVLSLILEE